MNIEIKALKFATSAHNGQVRKYTGEPYINHPKAVAKLVKTVKHTKEMVAAAFLHDTVEDTPVTIDEIREEFGDTVAKYVAGLTDVSKPDDGIRKIRKEIDRQHLAKQCGNVHTIKLADLIDNSHSIVKRDPSFAAVYMEEKKLLLPLLRKGDSLLWEMAKGIVDDYYGSR